MFNRAIADGLIAPGASPAHQVAKPRRLPNTRRALTADELARINAAARIGGNDVILDALILRLHTETACRRGGALGLRLVDLDVHNGLVCLAEKGCTQRWQPITLDLAQRLAEHAQVRGAVLPTEALLRYRNGRTLTSRRYDQLWKRIGQQLPWVAVYGVSTHWLHHTTLTWVERHFGYGIARAYPGHTDCVGPATTTYIKADNHDIATALAAMTGQPHPLARQRQRGAAVRQRRAAWLRLRRQRADGRTGFRYRRSPGGTGTRCASAAVRRRPASAGPSSRTSGPSRRRCGSGRAGWPRSSRNRCQTTGPIAVRTSEYPAATNRSATVASRWKIAPLPRSCVGELWPESLWSVHA